MVLLLFLLVSLAALEATPSARYGMNEAIPDKIFKSFRVTISSLKVISNLAVRGCTFVCVGAPNAIHRLRLQIL